MKKILLFSLFLMIGLLAQAQSDTLKIETTTPQDSVKTKKKKKRSISITFGEDDEADSDDSKSKSQKAKKKERKPRKKEWIKTRWLMLDYGISAYRQDGSMNLSAEYMPFEQKYWGSHNWNLHVVKQRVNLVNHKLNLMYGLTFEFNRYNLRNNVGFEPNETAVTVIDYADKTFEDNRLNATYLTVPFMLNYESNPDRRSRSFRINAGVYGGLLLTGRLKQESDDGTIDHKIDDDFNLNQFRYGIATQIGFGNVNFYINYGLSDLFDKDENGGFDLQPINFGITILPF